MSRKERDMTTDEFVAWCRAEASRMRRETAAAVAEITEISARLDGRRREREEISRSIDKMLAGDPPQKRRRRRRNKRR